MIASTVVARLRSAASCRVLDFATHKKSCIGFVYPAARPSFHLSFIFARLLISHRSKRPAAVTTSPFQTHTTRVSAPHPALPTLALDAENSAEETPQRKPTRKRPFCPARATNA
jgi:hypothetical protein